MMLLTMRLQQKSLQRIILLFLSMKTNHMLSRKNFWIITVNSTVSFILAYLLIFYINQFMYIFTATMFHIPVSFDWDQVYYHIEPYQWTHDMVSTIFAFGPIMIFILGIVFLGAFYAIKEEKSNLKMFFVWFSLIAFNSFFGNLLIGNLFTKGMGFVFQWMYLSDTARLVIALIGFFGLLLTAVVMKRPILYTSNNYFNTLNEKNFPFFFTGQVILPFIFGSLLSIAYFYPRILIQERYSWATLAVVLFLVYKNTDQNESVYFDEDEEPHIRLSLPLIIITLVLYAGLRFLFNSPHNFF
jgi:hypothetical protein